MREAFFLLARYRAATRLVRFKRLTRSLKHSAQATEPAPVNEQAMRRAVQVGGIVARVGRHTPWQSPCLVQVLAVQHMLSRRGIPGIFYLGVRKQNARQAKPSELDAHAWLKCGTEIINGAEGHEAYTLISSWSWG